MKYLCLALVMFAITNHALASLPIQTSFIKEKLNEVEKLKSTIATTRTQFDATAKELKEQRIRLQEKLREARQDLKNKTTDLKSSVKKILDDLDAALKKYKDTPKLTTDTQEAEVIAARAASDTTSLRQASETLDTIELPREILD